MSDIGDSAVPVVEPATPAPDQPESTTEGETQEVAEKVEAEGLPRQALGKMIESGDDRVPQRKCPHYGVRLQVFLHRGG